MRSSLRRALLVFSLAGVPLFAAPSALANLPATGPELAVSAPDYSAYFANDSAPVIGTNGTDALIVWQGRTYAGTTSVFCARFTAAGVLLDKDAIALSIPYADLGAFWDGTKYVVVSGGAAQRVNPATGAVEAPLAWGASTSIHHTVASGGGLILDAWTDSANELHATLLEMNGTIVKSDVPLASLPGSFVQVAAGYSNGDFLVAWTGDGSTPGGTVEGVRVSSTGALVNASPIVIDAGHAQAGADAGAAFASTTSLGVAGSPSGFLATWSDARSGPGHDDVYFARVGTNGSVADPGGALAATNSIDGMPSATWTGTAWWVAWNIFTFSYFVNGVTIGTNATLGSVQSVGDTWDYGIAPPAVTATATTRFGAWQTGDGEILGGRFDTTGAALDGSGVFLSSHLLPQRDVGVAASSAGYLVSWTEPFFDSAGGNPNTSLATRFALDGTPIDTTPVTLAQTLDAVVSTMGSTYVAAMAANGGITLVTLPETGAATLTPLGALGVSRTSTPLDRSRSRARPIAAWSCGTSTRSRATSQSTGRSSWRTALRPRSSPSP